MDDPEESEMERLSLREFEQTANFTALAGLSDWCVENTRPHFGACLKEVAAAASPAAHWFYANFDELHGAPVAATGRGRVRQAVQWALAEAWAIGQKELDHLRFDWDYDPDDDGVFPLAAPHASDRRLWRCVAQRLRAATVGDDAINYWDHTAELGPIDLGEPVWYDRRRRRPMRPDGKGIPRVRFVEAELAARVMREEKVPFPAWALPEPHKPVPKVEPGAPVIVLRWDFEHDRIFGLVPELPSTAESAGANRCVCYTTNTAGQLIETGAVYADTLRRTHYCSQGNAHALLQAIERAGVKVRVRQCAPKGYVHKFSANLAARKNGS